MFVPGGGAARQHMAHFISLGFGVWLADWLHEQLVPRQSVCCAWAMQACISAAPGPTQLPACLPKSRRACDIGRRRGQRRIAGRRRSDVGARWRSCAAAMQMSAQVLLRRQPGRLRASLPVMLPGAGGTVTLVPGGGAVHRPRISRASELAAQWGRQAQLMGLRMSGPKTGAEAQGHRWGLMGPTRTMHDLPAQSQCGRHLCRWQEEGAASPGQWVGG